MDQPPELCSLDHLAKLFQKQLLEVDTYTYRIDTLNALLELWLCCPCVSWYGWTDRGTIEES